MAGYDLNAQLQQAVALAQAGQRSEARALLEAVVAADPSLEVAWLWLASVTSDRAERIAFLERALAINPGNLTTQEAYIRVAGRPYAPPTPAAAAVPAAAHSRNRMQPIIIIGAVAMVAIAVLMIAIRLRGGTIGPGSEPTAYIFPTDFPTPTPLYSPTPSNTPLPTITPGPSPTPLWMAPPATWTPAPTETLPPTRTLAPTWTPRPSASVAGDVPAATETLTLATQTETPSAQQVVHTLTAEALSATPKQ
jgi:hypothetical protein